MKNSKSASAVLIWMGMAAFSTGFSTLVFVPDAISAPAGVSVDEAQAKYDSLVKEAASIANKAIELNKIATSALTESTKEAAAAASAKAAAATAKRNSDTASAAYTRLLAAVTAAETALKNAQLALSNNKDAKKTALLKAALDKATITQKAAQTAADKGKQSVADASTKYKGALAASDKVAAGAKESLERYNSAKTDAANAATNAKSAAADVLAAKKVLDAAIAAAKASGGSTKTLSDTATNANGLTFKEELSEQLPRVMGAKGPEGPNMLTITDNGYDSVACRYGMRERAFERDWYKGELTKGKVNSWKIPLEPNEGGNSRYWITCQASRGDQVIYSDTVEYIMQDRLSGTDWAKARCDFPVSGKTDKFFVNAALKAIKKFGPVYKGTLPLDPEAQKALDLASESSPKAKEKDPGYVGKVNIVAQPYEGNFGRSHFRFATQNKKVTMSSDGKLLIARRTWSNTMSGCNLPAAKGAVKYQVTKKDPLRWVPNQYVTPVFVEGLKNALYPLNKTAPLKGAKNIYNTNAKVGTAFVMNSRGHGVLLNDSGLIVRKFTNGPKYLQRMMRHHWIEGDENLEFRLQDSR